MDPRDRVALITGGARRVGRALALGLAEAGADVAIHYHASAAEAEETAGATRRLGRRAQTYEADLSDPAAPARLVARVTEDFGRLDILVNSASLFEAGSFEAVTVEDWDRVMAVNLRAPYLLTREAAGALRAGGGVVINIGDLSGLRPWTSFPHHGISKAGLVHLTKVAARALAPDVRVNCVVPGTVLPPEDYTEEQVERSADLTVLKRIGSPADVVEAALFLVRSDFATGSVVIVDGGRMLR